jgi:lipoprotein-anchoring transpeptidase ErfK/SrfK
MNRVARTVAFAATVLVFAAVGLALRSVLDGDDGTPSSASSSSAARGAPPAPVGGTTKFSADAATATARGTSLVARVKGHSVLTYRHRGGKPTRVGALRVEGKPAPLVFLVQRRHGDWLNVKLGRRPNGAHAWVRASAVTLSTTRYTVQIQLRKHRLAVRRGKRTVLRAPIAVGKSLSPTPTGRYFFTDLIKPKNPRGFYGPYAFGLSAYSSVYTSFAGGDGQVGIHGTSTPSVIGTDVSHGCIRVRNSVIRRLAARVPLGSPVEIQH